MKRLSVNEEICIACGLCQVFCRVAHSRSQDLVKSHKQEKTPARIRVESQGTVALAVACLHCEEPGCVSACLTGALYKDRETGLVKFIAEKCIGCWSCVVFCPYDVIIQDQESEVIVKCDMCPFLTVPACVSHCPNEALKLEE